MNETVSKELQVTDITSIESERENENKEIQNVAENITSLPKIKRKMWKCRKEI